MNQAPSATATPTTGTSAGPEATATLGPAGSVDNRPSSPVPFGQVGTEEEVPGPVMPGSAMAPVDGSPLPAAMGGAGQVVGTGGNPPVVAAGGDGQIVTGQEPTLDPMVDEAATCVADPSFVDPTAPGRTFPYESIAAEVATTLDAMSSAEMVETMGGAQHCEGTYWCMSNRAMQFTTADVAGVSGLKFRDGPRGLAEWEEESNPNRRATSFPTGVMRAASFDLPLEYAMGAAHCTEVLAAGWNTILAPTVTLTMHPSNGRAQESYGEDPWLNGKMGSAFVIGCQQYAQACPKHYAANEVENERLQMTANMDERTLREDYTRAFEMVVEGADPACIMASYNAVNGTPVAENAHLLGELLRTAFGFNGYVVSDWAAVQDGVSSANAGLDVEMPEHNHYDGLEGRVDASVLRNAASRILTQKVRFGFGASPADCCADTAQVSGARTRFGDRSYLEHPDHLALVEQGALEGTVLLKNDANVLPITTAKYGTIAVLAPLLVANCEKGQNADCPKGTLSFWDTWEYDGGQGSWARQARLGDKGGAQVFPSARVSPLAALQGRAPAGMTIIEGADPALSAQADLAVVFAALTSFDEGEEWQNGADRESLDLPDGQGEFIAQVAAQGKPTVVVLYGGAPITMEDWKNDVPSIVMGWYPGMNGNNAIADLLYGNANFSGRLPQTWPVSMNDAGARPQPAAPDYAVDYPFLFGYRRFEAMGIAPLFPFGHGLSYTTYGYNGLTVDCGGASKDAVVHVSAEVTNQGNTAGTEVVQVYVGFPSGPDSPLVRPVKEYKVSQRVALDPGQTKRVTIPLRVADWSYFDTAANDWAVETGEHRIYVGHSSAEVEPHMIATVMVQ